ncbi:6-pyruvoyl trahydropterin synthase family protein [Nonomuraea sp. NPDC051941]|uniref:6-pyruvoyl trahydropterin synthase family protein n=1 Tax=Nonomuraea sp. NPDC051941 TaxID=3364373 RepID=UPI0037C55A35
MFTATLAHTFDAAHRLPHLPGKCTNLHGHTWRVSFTVGARFLSDDATLVEFGAFKRLMRDWIDDRIDHAAMLGAGDPLVAALRDQGCRVFTFGVDYPTFAWPTVEAVASMLAHQADDWLEQIDRPADAMLLQVDVSETPNNTASWMINPTSGPLGVTA